MSRPRFLADHNLNEHIIDGVQRREPVLEFTRIRDLGMSESEDADILAFAAQQGFIVVSHDVNTMTAAAHERLDRGQPMLMVQQTKAIAPVIDSLVLIWSASEAEEWHGQIGFLPL